MTPLEDLSSWIALSVVPGLGDQSLRKLLKEFGPPDQILTTTESALSQIVGSKLAEHIKSHDSTEIIAKTLAWLEQPNHALFTWADAGYPPLMLQTAIRRRSFTLKVGSICFPCPR
ncbi:MAG: hypothetical protein ABIW48_09020 [Burkholderiales bacterium]